MERDQAWLYPAFAVAIAATLCAAILKYLTGYPGLLPGGGGLIAAVTITLLTALFRVLWSIFDLWRSGEEKPIARIRKEWRSSLAAFLPVAAGIAILGIFLSSMTFLKSMIPAVVPFWADEALAATDRALFIDSEAFALSMKPALRALGIFYGFWHGVHLGGILWVLNWKAGNKARHILSFMLTWSIGMALAFAFSSTGPLFTGGYDPAVAPESVQKAAAFLWANYQAGGAQIGGGISAFPSMHVALAAWLAIVLKDRGLPILGVAYLAGVFLCSIILGWHYAIDGVAGVAIALVANRLARSWLRGGAVTAPLIVQPAGSLD